MLKLGGGTFVCASVSLLAATCFVYFKSEHLGTRTVCHYVCVLWQVLKTLMSEPIGINNMITLRLLRQGVYCKSLWVRKFKGLIPRKVIISATLQIRAEAEVKL